MTLTARFPRADEAQKPDIEPQQPAQAQEIVASLTIPLRVMEDD